MADAADVLRRAGRGPGRYAGIPISLKDLVDIAGEVTTAGSVALAGKPPAVAHAPVVARMLAAAKKGGVRIIGDATGNLS